jgi:hypothetical protein
MKGLERNGKEIAVQNKTDEKGQNWIKHLDKILAKKYRRTPWRSRKNI